MNITIREVADLGMIASPFAAKDDVKALTGARWEPTLKVWTIPAWTIRGAADELRYLGYVVTVHAPDGRPWNTPAKPQVNEPWEAMFSAVPVALRAKTYRALVKVLHPGAGGDLAAMQALARAYSKMGA